jgi:excisionase family DNA binding protein
MTTTVDDNDPLVKVSSVAEIFGVQPRTVREWIKSGKIKATSTPGGQYRIPQSEVQRLADAMYGSNA